MSENSQDTDLNGAHIKRVAPAHSRNSNRGGGSIELLHIIAMFMILMHHFIIHNGYDVKKLRLDQDASSSNSSCRAAARSELSSLFPSTHIPPQQGNSPSRSPRHIRELMPR